MNPSVALTFSTLLFVAVLSPALPSHWCMCLKSPSELQPTKDAISRALKGRHGAGMPLTSSWLLLAMWIQAEGTGWETVSAEPLPNSLPEGPCSQQGTAGEAFTIVFKNSLSHQILLCYLFFFLKVRLFPTAVLSRVWTPVCMAI